MQSSQIAQLPESGIISGGHCCHVSSTLEQVQQSHAITGCEKDLACLNLPSLPLPNELGSQCTAHQPKRNFPH